MALPLPNPQDPEYVNQESKKPPKKKKKKPSRTILYLRHRAKASNLSMIVVGSLLAILSCHRVISLYMSHRRWLNAPITYMHRQCPAPGYRPLSTTSAPPPRICLTTLTDSKSPSLWQRFMRWRNYDGILELTWPNKLQYAAKHGYRVVDQSHLIDTSRPPAWSKIPAVSDLLRSGRCDWVMWTDADTIIMNSDVRVEDFIPADDNVDLLVGSDDYGGGYNSGVFLLRRSPWSLSFLERWWAMTDYVRPPGLSLSGDNNAMKALLADLPEFDRKVRSPPRCTFNSFAWFLTVGQSAYVMDHLEEQEWYMSDNYYHRSDFIAHTPGYDNKQECIRLLLQEAQ